MKTVRPRARRIMVVDDNEAMTESLSLWLEELGHEVRCVDCGERALAEVSAFQPHVILVDIGLPGISGHETARALRAMPDMRGVVLVAATGYGQESDRHKSATAGFDQHWVKPISPDKLDALLASPAVRAAP